MGWEVYRRATRRDHHDRPFLLRQVSRMIVELELQDGQDAADPSIGIFLCCVVKQAG